MDTSERTRTTSFGISDQLSEAVEDYAARCGLNRSAAIRALIMAELERQGHWPPARQPERAAS